MNKFLCLLIAVSACLFAGCSSFLDSFEITENPQTVETAVYEIKGRVETGTSRSAVPQVNLSSLYYQISGENLTTGKTYSGTVDSTEKTYSISLTNGSIRITIEAFTDSACSASKKALSGTATFTLEGGVISTGSTSINLKGITGNSTTGKVALPVKISSDSGITGASAVWLNSSGNTKTADLGLNASSTTEATFKMIADEDLGSVTTVDSGVYTVLFNFYKDTDLVYSFVENISVYSNLTTDTWLNTTGDSYISSGSVLITSTLVSSYTKTTYYIAPSGSNTSGNGGFFSPFASVQKAVDVISAKNDGVTEYSIYLLGDIEAASDHSDWPKTSDGSENAESLVTIDSSSTLKLKISSFGNPATPYKIDAKSTSTKLGRVLYAGENAVLTLEKVHITGGYTSEKPGGGIYSNGSITINDCEISSNTVTGSTNYYGGGIFLDASSSGIIYHTYVHDNSSSGGSGVYTKGITVLNDCEISGNDGAGWGGGLRINHKDSICTVTGCTIKNNKANVCGGVEIVYGTMILEDCIIEGNTSKNTADYSGDDLMLCNNPDTCVTTIKGSTTIAGIISIQRTEGDVIKKLAFDSLTGTAETQNFKINLQNITPGETAVYSPGGYEDRIKVYSEKGTTDLSSLYKIDSDGKLIYLGGAVGPNGGNAGSSYTVISTVAACGETAPSTAGVYSLSTEAELKKLSEWVNGSTETGAVKVFEGFTFVLYDNIPLTETWTPIGTYTSTSDMKCFSGIIDGNGNTITNLTINEGSTARGGLVRVAYGSSIKNLTLEGTLEAKGYSGAFVGYSYGNLLLDNCVSKVDIVATGNTATGGIVGYLTGASGESVSVQIQNCANFGTVKGSASTGGILGSTSSTIQSVKITNCICTGTVEGTSSVGGIAGRPVGFKMLDIENCIVKGEVTGSSNVGSIIGELGASYSLGQSIDYCYYDEDSSDNAVGKDTGVTYTYGEHFASFTSNGSSSTLATAVLSTTDVKEALNNWITSSSLGNDSAYTTYKQWYYQTDGDGTPTIAPYTVVIPSAVDLSSLASAPTDSTKVYSVASMADFTKLATWVNTDGNTFEDFTFKFSDENTSVNLSGDFTPIGTSSNPFKGTFDGSNVSITGVALSSSTSNLGFFGYAEDATIKNLKIEGSVTSTVSSSSYANAGGLVGVAKGAVTIDNCDVKMVITCSGRQVGGIVGNFESGTLIIRNTINRGGVSGSSEVGGIVGNSYPTATSSSASIFNCINYGSVTGTGANVGGILGCGNKTSVENCISKPNGTISGGSNTGKLCGNITANSNLSYSYFLANTSTETDYTGTTSGQKLNNNIFNINNTKPCFLNAGTDCNGDSYSTGDEVLTIMNKWVEKANVADNIYLKVQYEGGSGDLGFVNLP